MLQVFTFGFTYGRKKLDLTCKDKLYCFTGVIPWIYTGVAQQHLSACKYVFIHIDILYLLM